MEISHQDCEEKPEGSEDQDGGNQYASEVSLAIHVPAASDC